jgi:hypothetical protein
MPSRRISSTDNLAPVQEIAVNPYSSYNSDNVNMLTRAVTGQKEKDFVVKGLDLYGVNRVTTEVIDPTIPIDDHFAYVNDVALQVNWITENVHQNPGKGAAMFLVPSPNKYANCKLQSKTVINQSYVNDWFKIEFKLENTAKQLHILFGSEVKTYTYAKGGSYSFYTTLKSTNGVYENLTFVVSVDNLDPYSDQVIYIDDVKLTRIINKAESIIPITDPDIFNAQGDIPEYALHPHESIQVSPGICIKDEAVVSMLGIAKNDGSVPLITLNYGDADSWINGVPFSDVDFPGTETSHFYNPGGSPIPVSFTNGELNTDSLDDGEVGGPRKIEGDSILGAQRAYVKWAYIVVYYSYFKNPNPNKAYIGLATEDEVTNARYGEDFLILGKCRFIDKNTVDAIFTYPDRQDFGFIDADRVTYLDLSSLWHWLSRPQNVSIALDLLASRIYHWKGVLFFQRHQDFINWIQHNLPCGTGHGPRDYLQWRDGQQTDQAYDLLAYVVETNSFWKSKIKVTGEIDSITISSGGENYQIGDPITFVGGIGRGAGAQAIIAGGEVSSITLISGGLGFALAPLVTISGDGINAAAHAVIADGKITDIIIDNPGSGYTAATITIDNSNASGAGTVTSVSGTGIIETTNISSGGTYWSDHLPTLSLPTGGGRSGGALLPVMDPDYSGYDLQIEWEELGQKQFEIDWSLVNEGAWPWPPIAIPADWLWYDSATGTESAGITKTLSQAHAEWPDSHYRVHSTGPGQYSVVNPFNIRGRGMVPGPRADLHDTKFNKFLRADGTWQPSRGGALIVDSYEELCRWYHAANSSYFWASPGTNQYLEKVGRVSEIDYDVMVLVKEDNTWWITPPSPVELQGESYRGYNWGDIAEGTTPEITDEGYLGGASYEWTNFTGANYTDANVKIRQSVPRCIKPLLEEFQIRWNPASWTPIANGWIFKSVSIDASGVISVAPSTKGSSAAVPGGYSPSTRLDHAQILYPKYAYVVENINDDGEFRLVNPFNPSGNNLVPGPEQDKAEDHRYLRSDGQWAEAGALDLHFEAKGYLTATDNLVQGMCGHNGTLKGVHVWSDIPIDLAAGSGLKVDILLTKEVTNLGFSWFETRSIFIPESASIDFMGGRSPWWLYAFNFPASDAALYQVNGPQFVGTGTTYNGAVVYLGGLNGNRVIWYSTASGGWWILTGYAYSPLTPGFVDPPLAGNIVYRKVSTDKTNPTGNWEAPAAPGVVIGYTNRYAGQWSNHPLGAPYTSYTTGVVMPELHN